MRTDSSDTFIPPASIPSRLRTSSHHINSNNDNNTPTPKHQSSHPSYSIAFNNSSNNNNNDTLNISINDSISDSDAMKLLLQCQSKNDLLSNFSTDEIQVLYSEILRIIQVDANERVTSKGEAATFCGIVLYGTFTVNVESDVITNYLHVADLFGEMSYFEHSYRTADIICTAPKGIGGVVAIIQFDDIPNLLIDGHNTLYTKVIQTLGNAAIRRLRSMIPIEQRNDPLSKNLNEREIHQQHSRGSQRSSMDMNSMNNGNHSLKSHTSISSGRQQESLFMMRLKKATDDAAIEIKKQKEARRKAEQKSTQNAYYVSHLENCKIKLENEIKEWENKYNLLTQQLISTNKKLEKALTGLEPLINTHEQEIHSYKTKIERLELDINYNNRINQQLKEQSITNNTMNEVIINNLKSDLELQKKQYKILKVQSQWKYYTLWSIYNKRYNTLNDKYNTLNQKHSELTDNKFNNDILLNETVIQLSELKNTLLTTQENHSNELLRVNTLLADTSERLHESHNLEKEWKSRYEKMEKSEHMKYNELLTKYEYMKQREHERVIQHSIAHNLVRYFTIRNFIKNWRCRRNIVELYFIYHDLLAYKQTLYQQRTNTIWNNKHDNKEEIIVIKPASNQHKHLLSVSSDDESNTHQVKSILNKKLELKRLPLLTLIEKFLSLTQELQEIDEKLNHELCEIRLASNAFFQRNINIADINVKLQLQIDELIYDNDILQKQLEERVNYSDRNGSIISNAASSNQNKPIWNQYKPPSIVSPSLTATTPAANITPTAISSSRIIQLSKAKATTISSDNNVNSPQHNKKSNIRNQTMTPTSTLPVVSSITPSHNNIRPNTSHNITTNIHSPQHYQQSPRPSSQPHGRQHADMLYNTTYPQQHYTTLLESIEQFRASLPHSHRVKSPSKVHRNINEQYAYNNR